jgi:hypothetical protein
VESLNILSRIAVFIYAVIAGILVVILIEWLENRAEMLKNSGNTARNSVSQSKLKVKS